MRPHSIHAARPFEFSLLQSTTAMKAAALLLCALALANGAKQTQQGFSSIPSYFC